MASRKVPALSQLRNKSAGGIRHWKASLGEYAGQHNGIDSRHGCAVSRRGVEYPRSVGCIIGKEQGMNENAKKWVAALRSGKYRQGRGALCRDDSFCCLGVACDVYQKEVGGMQVRQVANMVQFNGETGVLPKVVRLWLGTFDENPDLVGADTNTCPLAARNDRGESFESLADLIEKNAESVFEAAATSSERSEVNDA